MERRLFLPRATALSQCVARLLRSYAFQCCYLHVRLFKFHHPAWKSRSLRSAGVVSLMMIGGHAAKPRRTTWPPMYESITQEEIERRIAAIDAGKVELIPWSEVRKRLFEA